MKIKLILNTLLVTFICQSLFVPKESKAVIGTVGLIKGSELGYMLVPGALFGFIFGPFSYSASAVLGVGMSAVGLVLLDDNGIPVSFKTITEDSLSSLGLEKSDEVTEMISDYNDDLWLLNSILETRSEMQKAGANLEEVLSSEVGQMMQKLHPGTIRLMSVLEKK